LEHPWYKGKYFYIYHIINYTLKIMRKLLLSGAAILVASLSALAGNAELFNYNEAELQSSLSELNQLEEVVLADENATFESLQLTNQELLVDVSEQPSLSDASQGEPVAGIPSWIWGCVLGIIGVAIVYFVTEDKDETVKALYGLIAYVVVVVIYIIVVVGATTTAAASVI
jgi:hypothetical protein